MPTWPTAGDFPQLPSQEGFEEEIPENVFTSNMDVGPAKKRRRTTANVGKFKMKWELTLAQVATLKTFYITTLASGALSFDMDHPITGVSGTFRFGKPPKISSRGSEWFAMAEMEQLP